VLIPQFGSPQKDTKRQFFELRHDVLDRATGRMATNKGMQ
jgi:hypothetical protein